LVLKILVVYYSRSGVTRQLAHVIARMINADIEEIRDSENRAGVTGFVRSGYEAALDRLTSIEETEHDVESYDLVVVGSPVWAGKPSTPITSFVKKYGHKIENFAVFLTHGDAKNDYAKTVVFIEKAVGKQAVKTLSVATAAARKAEEDYRVISFINDLNKL
jgi:menaquinone-dependent protoporphyrinogen IX oxidase